MENSKGVSTEKKKAPKWFVALFLIVSVFLIVKCMRGNGKPTAIKETENIEWQNMTYEQREAWIKEYLKGDEKGITITDMKTAIKKQLNYPEEVDFPLEETPSLSRGRIVDAETGTVFVDGTGTAPNAFGVKSSFRYSVKLKVTKDSLFIAAVFVNP